MNFERESALEMLDNSLSRFENLEKRIRMYGVDDETIDDYNGIYLETIEIVTHLFSEDEGSNFSQQSSVPSYYLEPEEAVDVYHQSTLECIGMLEEYRQRLSIERSLEKGYI